jgi:hypothetical protein
MGTRPRPKATRDLHSAIAQAFGPETIRRLVELGLKVKR